MPRRSDHVGSYPLFVPPGPSKPFKIGLKIVPFPLSLPSKEVKLKVPNARRKRGGRRRFRAVGEKRSGEEETAQIRSIFVLEATLKFERLERSWRTCKGLDW
jgi:hypothetical protein